VECLTEAIEKRRKEDDFEESLSRALRRHDQDYDAYIRLIGIVREVAGKDRKDLFLVARQVLESSKGQH
jgi:Ca2+-binding EF-hand superfamily protein